MRSPTWDDVLVAAQRRIDRDDELVYDLCANRGQILANVKHLKWLHVAVAKELVNTVKKYENVIIPENCR
jgi:hypothetical protein